ncbi:MAG TPA: ATP-binding cassette domain-containing protein, partial [Gemmatimonadales bacterium]|nr:ATP-binding cassette domain-containing protein [Gemmatimonadales bacterium]
MLELRLDSRRGEFELDLAFDAPTGATTVIVGESGAGKTSVLRMAAGLDRPLRGRVVLDGEVYTDADAGVHLPP